MIQPIIPINWIILTLSYQYARRVICLRQARTWDPLLQCLYLDKHLLRQQTTKKTIRDESNSMHAQLGQIMNKKTKKSNCHFGGVQIKKVPMLRRVACVIPVHGTTKGGGQTTYITSLFLPTHVPLLFLSSCSVLSTSLQPQGPQHARLLWPPLSPRVCSNSCPLNQCCYLTNHLILSCTRLLLPSIFSRIRLFSNESDPIKWLRLHR